MKLSTLINQLKTIEAKHGDLEVKFREPREGKSISNTTYRRVLTFTVLDQLAEGTTYRWLEIQQ